MARTATSMAALLLVLAGCGLTEIGDEPTGTTSDDSATAPADPAEAETSEPEPTATPDGQTTPSPESSPPATEVVVTGEGQATTVSDPFTTDGTLRGFIVEGTTTGSDRAQVVLWLAETTPAAADETTIPDGCTGVGGAPPDLTIEDAASDGSDGCALLQVLPFEPNTGPAGGLGEPIPAGTWQIWAVPFGPAPSWRVTYRTCQDTVEANPSLFVADELSGEFCNQD